MKLNQHASGTGTRLSDTASHHGATRAGRRRGGQIDVRGTAATASNAMAEAATGQSDRCKECS